MAWRTSLDHNGAMETIAPTDVLAFWFSERVRPLWFQSTAELDREIAERFGETWRRAREGHLAHWADSPEGALALVIVLDQFPLNMFRGRAEAYATEAMARTVAEAAIGKGWDQGLSDERKTFLYLPFMHSEAVADQERSVALYRAAGLEDSLRWALHHRDLIRRFGRFPHRNAALGRADTPEEARYLASEEAFLG